MRTTFMEKQAHRNIDTIFTEILPRCGMTRRDEQIRLCHTMLDAMLHNNIALSDAGTGIGKTYAYLVAGIVYDRLLGEAGEPRRAITISTATVALQKAIHEEYIPFLSEVLLDAGFINEPILSVVRKGKHRYVCDKRLDRRLREVNFQKKNKQNADALLSLREHLDMDEAEHLSGYDRRHVCVPRSCRGCLMECRYREFVEDCASGDYLIQICNHNLLLADAMHTRCDRHPILQPYCALVVDEAHKLPAAARQMFGRTFGKDNVMSLASDLRTEQYKLAAQNLIETAEPLIDGLNAKTDEEIEIFERKRRGFIRRLLRTLQSIKRVIGEDVRTTTAFQLSEMITTLDLFLDRESDVILYMDEDEMHRPILCAVAADLSDRVNESLWSMEAPILLTSGTLAVNGDFSRFKAEAYLADCGRVTETVSLSPFDYESNCSLYLPYTAPILYRDEDTRMYYKEIADRIAELIEASHGHTLVLFNSYTAMSAVRVLLEDKALPYPIFTMSKNGAYMAERFRQSRNGVLLATGAAWEGMDFPGDLVSMLIIPRLPFPIPDAFSDHQKERYETLREFIEDVAVPDMQIRLRQGFGRAIRLETDTCVVAILDERALRGGRYHAAALATLPEMPITGSLHSVERFYRSMKDDEYFGEDMAI